jgi:hypothetical protein
MDDTELRNTLQRLAYYVVRNEVVCEYFLTQALPVTRDEIGAKRITDKSVVLLRAERDFCHRRPVTHA